MANLLHNKTVSITALNGHLANKTGGIEMIYEMFNDVPIYECDPDKNKDCEKTFCVFNIDAKGRECHCCISSDYEWDGKKARKVKRRNN